MTKKVFDIGIEVKRATMHVLANSPEEAFQIAKDNIDDWYNDFYFYHDLDFEDNPTVVDCSEYIYLDQDEDDPLYGSDKYDTLGEYMEADDEEEEEEEYEDPNQLAMDFGKGDEQ